jgi:hypothetical protein
MDRLKLAQLNTEFEVDGRHFPVLSESSKQSVRRHYATIPGSYSWDHAQSQMSYDHRSDSQWSLSYWNLIFKVVGTSRKTSGSFMCLERHITRLQMDLQRDSTFQSTRTGVPNELFLDGLICLCGSQEWPLRSPDLNSVTWKIGLHGAWRQSKQQRGAI